MTDADRAREQTPDLDLRFFHARTSVAALAVAARDWRDLALKAEADLAAALVSQPVALPQEPLDPTELDVLARAVRSLDCGVHYCRYCEAGTANQWQHDPNCSYERSVQDVEAARVLLARLRAGGTR